MHSPAYMWKHRSEYHPKDIVHGVVHQTRTRITIARTVVVKVCSAPANLHTQHCPRNLMDDNPTSG